MVRVGQVDTEPSAAYCYLDMSEENICEGPGLAGRHGQQLLESKDGAGRTGGHGAKCRGQNSAAGRAAPQRRTAAYSARVRLNSETGSYQADTVPTVFKKKKQRKI